MAARAQPTTHLVVIGSSAGGIDALSTLVATLPPDFLTPIVIAQHLDPTHPSHLAEILGRRSTLPVRTASNREHLKAGVIYVAPSNRQVQITDSEIVLPEENIGRFRPSIDLLLSSAAAAYGERLIAVILSGTGSDGAAGARAVKQAGGTVMIQDPETASFPEMPLSLASTTVDIVAPLERMGGILRDLVAGVPVPIRREEQRTLQTFLETVRARCGLDFTSYKPPTILRRLQRRIAATETDTLEGYTRYLETHPEEYHQLINALLIKVTEFFRDPEVFAALRESVLPEVIRSARARNKELRLWSAGCATGEEAYSLAMLVAEALGGELDDFQVRIFATDVDANAVAFARRGVYPASALSEVPEDLAQRYFSQDENHAQVKKRLRSLIVFGVHDLSQRAPFPDIDLVACRNVLIYFTPELQQRALQLFAYSLREGGYLVLGKAESITPLSGFYVLEHQTYKIYRRQGERLLMPLSRFSTPAPPDRLGLTKRTQNSLGLEQRLPTEVPRVRPLMESAWRQAPVGLVVVDRHYDIQGINSAARRYLAIRSSAVGEDLLHLMQAAIAQPVRTAIDLAFRSGAAATIEELPVEHATSGKPRYLQVICQPQQSEGEQGPGETVLVALWELTTLVERRMQVEQQLREATSERERLKRERAETEARQAEVMGRLQETIEQLEEANQELTGTNEEVRSTNEELLVHTEEAQAATEEVETLNEELQATNEELETLNEELQATIEELNTTNADLNARSQEVQELAHTSEETRAQLEAILSSLPSAVLVVNQEGAVVMTNPAYAQFFGGPGASLLARDAEGHLLAPGETPRERAARGEAFRMEFSLNMEDGSRRWFEAIGQPIRLAGGTQQGGVVSIRDITRRSLQEE